jgi:hypothetical protein
MKKISIILCFFVFSCTEIPLEDSNKDNEMFYKYFDPFKFEGSNILKNNTADYPYYKIYKDSLNRIYRIDEYLRAGKVKKCKIYDRGNIMILIDTISSGFKDFYIVFNVYFLKDKIIKSENYVYPNLDRIFTKYLSIYSGDSLKIFYLVGDDNVLRNDSLYNAKLFFLDEKEIVSNKLNIKSQCIKDKSFSKFFITNDYIILNTTFSNKDTVINKTFKYSKRKFDEYWIAKYNYHDSIRYKFYYEKYH